MLPTFHGEKMERLTGLMAEVAEREVAGWPRDDADRAAPAHAAPHARDHPAGRLRARVRARASTRCATGSGRCSRSATGRSACSRSRSTASRTGSSSGSGPFAKFVRMQEKADELIFELIDERRREERRGRRHPRDAARGAPRGRLADVRPGAARRADDAAGGRARDHRLHARLGVRAPAPPPGGPRAGCTRRSTRATDDAYLTATIQETLRRRPVLPNAAPAAGRCRRSRSGAGPIRRASAWCRTAT